MGTVPNFKKVVSAVLVAVLVSALAGNAPVAAVVSNPAPAAKISFTFDDGMASNLTQAAPVLAAHGLSGTAYITTGCIGMTTVPNDCAADSGRAYLTWEQVATLRDTYGWEIGAHSVTHPQLDSDNLTDAQLTAEVAGSKQGLATHGFDAQAFATPYGDYSNRVLAEIAKSFTSHRGFHDLDNNVWSYNDYLLNNMQVQEGVSVAAVQARIDDAIANNLWLVLTFHEISPTPDASPEEYMYATDKLNQIAAYVKSKQDAGQIKSVNVSKGLVVSDTNLLPNGGFEAGLTQGWTTNTPGNVVLSTAGKGGYPNPANAVSLTSGAANIHLFSPQVTVNSNLTYMFKSYLQLTARTGGELGYYVDEFDGAGNWISGQWVQAVTAPTTRNVNFAYKPSSTAVKKAGLQIYATANSGIQAYVDSFQFFPLNETTTPPPATINLLPNSNFTSGLAEGWTTNNTAAFTPDGAGNGSPENSASAQHAIKLIAGTANSSLFAPQVEVQSLDTYKIEAYLNILTRNNEEVAFYIDEYDLNGAWVSGQYAFAKRTTGIENLSIDYTPTTATVKKAGLQIILVGNSGITGYLDQVKFLGPGTPPDPAPRPNLLTNSTFDSGLSEGWATNDPVNITADNSNNGSPENSINAIKLLSSDVNRHLFSPIVTVDPTKSYDITSFLKILQINGNTGSEIGFYIDEYDINGNWISGQYKTGVHVISEGDVSFTYTPSSANISSAGLQIILVGNSGIQAYLDNVRWLLQN